MHPHVNFIFCVHNHQPVGNFDHVFEKAFVDAYLPFLDVVEQFPWFRFSAHFSGPLLEWLQEHKLEFLLRLKRLVDEDRLELIGGGFYEPILSMLPEEDTRGQIALMSDFLDKNFGQLPNGAWMAERVWEPGLARVLADAGVKYTILDDFHFKAVGLRDQDLLGYFITEDQGRLLRMFPIRESLRYAIPFREPEETVNLLLSNVSRDFPRTIVYADDGEKFGVWPKTKEHVYQNGWLLRFLKAIEKRLDVIRMSTFTEVIESVESVGKIYLPTCSYREMGEWTLFARGQEDYEVLAEQMRRSGQFERLNSFLIGGTWRNFKVKYPEANLMYGRMLTVSKRVNKLSKQSPAYKKASRELYRAQCNCAYWHGVFGGIYLPHLRDAIYRHLIAAERVLEGRSGNFGMEALDLDLDGSNEVRLSNKHLNVIVSPRSGGQIVELDLYDHLLNIQASFSRKYEHYHTKLGRNHHQGEEGVRTIHEIVQSKVQNPEAYRKYDTHLRFSLVDHFYPANVSLQDVDAGGQEQGDFAWAKYDLRMRKEKNRIALLLKHRGVVRNLPVYLEKELWLQKDERAVEVNYAISNESQESIDATFGVEYNFALLTPFFPESFIHTGNNVPASAVTARAEYVCQHLGVTDRTRNVAAHVVASKEARFLVLPVHTISMSEGGFELIWQSVCVMPTWRLSLKPGETFRVSVIERFT